MVRCRHAQQCRGSRLLQTHSWKIHVSGLKGDLLCGFGLLSNGRTLSTHCWLKPVTETYSLHTHLALSFMKISPFFLGQSIRQTVRFHATCGLGRFYKCSSVRLSTLVYFSSYVELHAGKTTAVTRVQNKTNLTCLPNPRPKCFTLLNYLTI